jgi:hypothetical protein
MINTMAEQTTEQQPYTYVRTGDVISLKKKECTGNKCIKDDKKDSEYTLVRTPSTYTYGQTLVTVIDEDAFYVVCNGDHINGFCLALRDDITKPIGFGLFYDALDKPYIRITQVGFDPIYVKLRICGTYVDPPMNKAFIGSKVFVTTVSSCKYETDQG